MILTGHFNFKIFCIEMAMLVNVCVFLRDFKLFLFWAFLQQGTSGGYFSSTHTMHQENGASIGKFIYAASLPICSSKPCHTIFKIYNSSPLILTRMKGCESKHVSPLDSGYRIRCGLLTIKYEIQAPLNFVAAVLMRVPITEEMQKLSV